MIAMNTSSTRSKTFGEKLLAFVFRRRVRITVAVFFLLIVEDLVNDVEPLNLADIWRVPVILGLLLVLFGVLLRSWAAGTLHKRTKLTRSGPYGVVRHPLYIGSILMMAGFSALVNDAENIWVVLGPVLAMFVLRSINEEKTLSAQFGHQWDEYVKSVPRFIPRRLRAAEAGDWSLKQWLKNREYQAVGATVLGLVAIQCWHLLRAA